MRRRGRWPGHQRGSLHPPARRENRVIGKIGDDDFGKQILQWYETKEGHFVGMEVAKGESTSYTIAICIPGIDRFYLHHTGANDSFGFDDMNWDLVERARLMLFGYPPWMKKIYENTGAEVTKILKKTKDLNCTTALDMALPDMNSYAGQRDWYAIRKNWVPLTDIMVPSAEELFYFLYKDEFIKKRNNLGPKETVLDNMTVSEISKLGGDILAMGTGVAMVKCGHRGLYIRTGTRTASPSSARPPAATSPTGPTANSGSRSTRRRSSWARSVRATRPSPGSSPPSFAASPSNPASATPMPPAA